MTMTPTEIDAKHIEAMREVVAQPQERAVRPAKDLFEHTWEIDGVAHRLAATMETMTYARGDVMGSITIEPERGELAPGLFLLCALEMMGTVAEGVAAMAARAARSVTKKAALLTADAFREANAALVADGAPEVASVAAMAGALVRTLRERREYAESYKQVMEDYGAPRWEALRKALDEAGEVVRPGDTLTQATASIRRLHAETTRNAPGLEALLAALASAGDTDAEAAPGKRAERVIRRLLAYIEGHRAVAPFDYLKLLSLIGGTDEPGRYIVPMLGEAPITFNAHAGDRPELRALHGEQLASALSKLCRLFNDEEHAAHAESILANTLTAYEDAVSPVRIAGDTVLDTVERLAQDAVPRLHQAIIGSSKTAFIASSRTMGPLLAAKVREQAKDIERLMAAMKLVKNALARTHLTTAYNVLRDALGDPS